MEKSVRVSEREYSKKMAELNRGFEVSLNEIPRSRVWLMELTLGGGQFILRNGKSNERSQ